MGKVVSIGDLRHRIPFECTAYFGCDFPQSRSLPAGISSIRVIYRRDGIPVPAQLDGMVRLRKSFWLAPAIGDQICGHKTD